MVVERAGLDMKVMRDRLLQNRGSAGRSYDAPQRGREVLVAQQV
jgi:hypothetical protein